MTTSRTSKVFALSLGQGLSTLVALASGMVMARILSQTELATYRQTMLAYDVAIPLLSLGISTGIYYFLPTEKSRARGLVADGLVMMLVMGLLYALFIALGGNNLLAKRFSNPAVVHTLVYLIPLPIIMLPAGLLASVMVVQNRINSLTLFNVLTGLFLATSIIVACLLWKTPEAMILMRVGVSIALGFIAIALIVQALPRDEWRPRWSSMKALVAFSLPLVLAGMLGTLSLQLDKVIVSSMCSPEAFAVYSTGALEIPFIGIMTGSIMIVVLPDLRRMIGAGDKQAALTLFRVAAEKSAMVLIPVTIFLMISAESFVQTLFSSKYADSVLPFRLYLLIVPVRIVTLGVFMTALGLNRIILYRAAVGLAVNAILGVLFVRWMGFIGAILATILSLYFIEVAWSLRAISRAVGCRWREILPFEFLFRLTWVSVLASVPAVCLINSNHNLSAPCLLGASGLGFALSLFSATWLFNVKEFKEEFRKMGKWVAVRLVPNPRSHL